MFNSKKELQVYSALLATLQQQDTYESIPLQQLLTMGKQSINRETIEKIRQQRKPLVQAVLKQRKEILEKVMQLIQDDLQSLNDQLEQVDENNLRPKSPVFTTELHL